MKSIRKAAVSGQFYPSDREELRKTIDFLLDKIPNDYVFPLKVKALMAPHASYHYSGLVAAYSYKAILNKKVNRVILLGDSHRVSFSGLALSEDNYWETPLGLISLDESYNKKIKEKINFSDFDNSIHKFDHIIEVQLAFLQEVLKTDFNIVPLILGEMSLDNCYSLANFFENNLKEDDLIIVSTDLSHYPSALTAEKNDTKTLDIIASKDVSLLEKHMKEVMNSGISNQETLICSPGSTKTLMILADKMSWEGKASKYNNSADISGDKSSVVGYGSLIFY
jgi:MEMO1 family protein